MSLDIDVTNTRTGESREMNWLRNPFGLCTWVENNYSYAMERDIEEDKRLWYVINNWNYDKAQDVDKPLFLEVVMKYAKVIMQLEQGYFWFDESAYQQFVHPCKPIWFHADAETFNLSGYAGVVRYHFYQREYIGIPMRYFGSPCFGLSDQYRPHAHTLAHYQEWYQHLIEFAEILQDPDAIFYCSN